MKIQSRIVAVLLVCTFAMVISGLYSCNSGSDTPPEPIGGQTVKVARGNLTTMVNAFGRLSLPHQANLGFRSSGTVAEVLVKFGDLVKRGDILAKLETDSLERAVVAAEGDLRLAQINLDRASSEDRIAKAEASVKNAKALLASAELALEQVQAFSVSDAETTLENARLNLATAQKNAEINITDAENQVDIAYDNYSKFLFSHIEGFEYQFDLQQQRDLLKWEHDKAVQKLEVAKENTAVSIAQAKTAVTEAENALTNVPTTIQQKESAVATAQAALDEAIGDLAYIEAGLDIEQLEIALSKAQIALDNARDQLAKAAIEAPFNGMIAELGIKAGNTVTANTTAIILVDTKVMEIDASVDEMDVAILDIGQKAEISVDALPKVKLTGEVTAISPIAQNVSGLITYDLVVSIYEIEGVNLKEGMTASVDIEAVLAQNVILVPSAAIQINRATGDATVTVFTDSGQEEARAIATGASSKQLTAVTSGLAEGELIVSGGSSAMTQSSRISQDSGGSDSVNMTDCLAKMGDLQECFGKLAAAAAERGISSTQQGGEIDWEEIEAWANDDSTSADVRECLETILKNRDCMEQLIKRAGESGM